MTTKVKGVRQLITATMTGRLGSDPEVNGSGKSFVKSSLAVNQRVKKDGEWTDGPTMWFDLISFDSKALKGYAKGDQVTITGTLRMQVYQDKQRYSLVIDGPEFVAHANPKAEEALDPESFPD